MDRVLCFPFYAILKECLDEMWAWLVKMLFFLLVNLPKVVKSLINQIVLFLEALNVAEAGCLGYRRTVEGQAEVKKASLSSKRQT